MIRRILVCLLCLCLLLGTFSVGAAAKPTPPPAVEKTYDAYYYILNPDMGTEPASTRDTSAFTFMGQGKVGDGIQAPGDNAVKGQTIDITDANENWLTAVPEVNKVQTFEKSQILLHRKHILSFNTRVKPITTLKILPTKTRIIPIPSFGIAIPAPAALTSALTLLTAPRTAGMWMGM